LEARPVQPASSSSLRFGDNLNEDQRRLRPFEPWSIFREIEDIRQMPAIFLVRRFELRINLDDSEILTNRLKMNLHSFIWLKLITFDFGMFK
jgi:hypothetical protein